MENQKELRLKITALKIHLAAVLERKMVVNQTEGRREIKEYELNGGEGHH